MTNETIRLGSDDFNTRGEQEKKQTSPEISDKMNAIFEESSQAILNLQNETDKIYLKSTSGLLRLMKYNEVIYIVGASNDYTVQLAGQLADLIRERMGLETKVSS